LKLFEQICLGAVTAGVLFLMWEGGTLERQSKLDEHMLAMDTHGAILKVDGVLGKAETVENRAIDASERVTAAAQKQSDYFSNTQQETYKAIVDLKTLVAHLDWNLNGGGKAHVVGVLPALARTLDATTTLQTAAVADLDTTTRHVNDTIDALRPMIDQGIAATRAASASMSDPAIHETFVHLASTSGHADKTAADVQQIADGWVKPIKGFWNHVTHFIVPAAVDAAQVATPIFARH